VNWDLKGIEGIWVAQGGYSPGEGIWVCDIYLWKTSLTVQWFATSKCCSGQCAWDWYVSL